MGKSIAVTTIGMGVAVGGSLYDTDNVGRCTLREGL